MIVCGTGHRPDKLGGYDEENFERLVNFLKKRLDITRPDKIISGMALGFDMALATASIELDIPLIAAIPFVGQELRWNWRYQQRYNIILENVVEKHIICEGDYDPYMFQLRNEWMVDNSDIVLALWNGSNGGTANCVKYAIMQNKPVINLYKDFING